MMLIHGSFRSEDDVAQNEKMKGPQAFALKIPVHHAFVEEKRNLPSRRSIGMNFLPPTKFFVVIPFASLSNLLLLFNL